MFFEKTIGYVLLDSERIEQCAFLENHSDLPAQLEQFLFRHGGDVVPQDVNAAAVGLDESQGEFQDERFAGTGNTEDGLSFAALDVERNSVKNLSVLKRNTDIVEDNCAIAF